MLGDFEEAKNKFLRWCEQHYLKPLASNIAIDLGAGNGVQSVALAEIGYEVKAIDFNRQLLAELDARRNGLSIGIILDDLKNISNYKKDRPELIVCCGDTISHLTNVKEIALLIRDSFIVLSSWKTYPFF